MSILVPYITIFQHPNTPIPFLAKWVSKSWSKDYAFLNNAPIPKDRQITNISKNTQFHFTTELHSPPKTTTLSIIIYTYAQIITNTEHNYISKNPQFHFTTELQSSPKTTNLNIIIDTYAQIISLNLCIQGSFFAEEREEERSTRAAEETRAKRAQRVKKNPSCHLTDSLTSAHQLVIIKPNSAPPSLLTHSSISYANFLICIFLSFAHNLFSSKMKIDQLQSRSKPQLIFIHPFKFNSSAQKTLSLFFVFRQHGTPFL